VTWEFAVSPAFYQRRLFQAGAVTAVGLLIWAAWQLKRRQDRERLGLVLAERTRLSREIHDTLLQGMAGTALHLGFISQSLALSSQEKVAQELEEARNRLESYVRETRNKIWDLRSQWLIANDFQKGVRDMVRSMSVGSDVKVNVRVVGAARPARASLEEQTLKIAHEAITNAVRHGHGSLVSVELHFRPDDLMLRVADNGGGIQVNGERVPDQHSWGLIGMRERAERIGARLTVEPGVEGGTELVAVVPWPAR
jgi:signal transduction histidine kinase